MVVTVNVTVVAFAGTVTLAGTCAVPVLLLDKVTTAPLTGAGPLSVTVAMEVFPPVTDAGFRLSGLRDAADTVNARVLVAPYTPVMVTVVFAETGFVVTVKVADVAFAATMTLGGTCAAKVVSLDRLTTAPAAGAGPFRVTVPVEEVPPITVVGLNVTLLRAAAVTVSEAVLVAP